MFYRAVLAIDSAMEGCGVAVLQGAVSATRSLPMARGQSEHLIPMVRDCMEEAGLGYNALEAVCVTIGPGAFTGLRIGLSAAKAFGLSLAIPVYGITTLQLLALEFSARSAGRSCAVIIETKRTDFYMQRFDERGAALCPPVAVEGADVLALLERGDVLLGDGVRRFCETAHADFAVEAGFVLPDILLAARLLCDPARRAAFMTEDLSPVYLRPPDVSFSKKAQRVLEG